MRLIDADALKTELDAWARIFQKPNHYAREDALYIIDCAPTIDAVPVVRGEWKLYGNDDDLGMSYWCSACNFQLSEDLFYSGYKNGRWIENGALNYCPNCGAKMDKEE
jgi:DNA-directed RNA polymerase subunit RPC12/RpoP